jgi:hypothetical protein
VLALTVVEVPDVLAVLAVAVGEVLDELVVLPEAGAAAATSEVGVRLDVVLAKPAFESPTVTVIRKNKCFMKMLPLVTGVSIDPLSIRDLN